VLARLDQARARLFGIQSVEAGHPQCCFNGSTYHDTSNRHMDIDMDGMPVVDHAFYPSIFATPFLVHLNALKSMSAASGMWTKDWKIHIFFLNAGSPSWMFLTRIGVKSASAIANALRTPVLSGSK